MSVPNHRSMKEHQKVNRHKQPQPDKSHINPTVLRNAVYQDPLVYPFPGCDTLLEQTLRLAFDSLTFTADQFINSRERTLDLTNQVRTESDPTSKALRQERLDGAILSWQSAEQHLRFTIARNKTTLREFFEDSHPCGDLVTDHNIVCVRRAFEYAERTLAYDIWRQEFEQLPPLPPIIWVGRELSILDLLP